MSHQSREDHGAVEDGSPRRGLATTKALPTRRSWRIWDRGYRRRRTCGETKWRSKPRTRRGQPSSPIDARVNGSCATPASLRCKEELTVIQIPSGQARRPHLGVIRLLTSSLSHAPACEAVGLTGIEREGDRHAPTGTGGGALGLHLELQSKQRLVIVEEASVRHGGIFAREKSAHTPPPPSASGSREHRFVCAAECILRSVVLPHGCSPGCSRLSAAASSPLRYPMRYRSRQRLLDNVTADGQLVQTLRQAGRSRKELFSSFFSFLLLQNSNEQQHPKCLLRAATATAPSRAPAARLLHSVRNADPLDIVISVNICRCFRAGTCVQPGNACRIGCFFARVSLAAEGAADDPDGSQWLGQVFCRDDMWAPTSRTTLIS